VLTARQLNRATLARQHLLERVDKPAEAVIADLVGLQAQEPQDPYIGLWSRIAGFQPAELERLLLDRRVVRLTVQRGTVHTVTAEDCLVLRPLAAPILTQQLRNHRDHGHVCEAADLDDVMRVAAEILTTPRSTRELRDVLAERFPDRDASALAFACRNLLAFVQVPPRGLWSRGGQVVGTTAEAWLGRPLEQQPSVADVIRRYLAAFGPATVRDAATWSRYTGLAEVFERLRPELRTFRDEAGREHFDVPGAPRPDPGVGAPVRLLPQYDNVLLGHADRTRFVTDAGLSNIWMEQTGFLGSVLVDGVVAGMWRFDRPLSSVVDASVPATLTVRLLPSVPRPGEEDVAAEAQRFAHFVAADTDHAVRIERAA
jgi:hypothetical protein